jgi:hypothetical protein
MATNKFVLAVDVIHERIGGNSRRAHDSVVLIEVIDFMNTDLIEEGVLLW